MWVKTQRKTFTAWCNQYLRKVGGPEIKDLSVDFSDGIDLCKLLLSLSGEEMPTKPNMRARGTRGARLFKIQNVGIALKFMKDHRIKLVGIGAEDIVDCNEKLILGLVWMLILRFQIEDVSMEGLSAKDGLLLWVQRKTAPYKNVSVKNFHRSWVDGLAFDALIHAHRDDLFDYTDLSPDSPRENMELAFGLMDKHYDVPKMFDPEDLLDVVKPDEKSIMTYVSAMYHAFQSGQKLDRAARRIRRLLQMVKENRIFQTDYERRARELRGWVETKLDKFSTQPAFDGTLEGAEDLYIEMITYHREEKRPRQQSKAELFAMFDSHQARLQHYKMSPYVPPEGLEPSAIDQTWDAMCEKENEWEAAVRSEMFKQEEAFRGHMKDKQDQRGKELIEAMRKEALAGLTDEMIAEYRDCFDHFDSDKSGSLELKELNACLHSLGEDLTLEETKAVVEEMDHSGDGKVEFDEFVQFMHRRQGDNGTKEEMDESFSLLTNNKPYAEAADLDRFSENERAIILANLTPASDGIDGHWSWDGLHQMIASGELVIPAEIPSTPKGKKLVDEPVVIPEPSIPEPEAMVEPEPEDAEVIEEAEEVEDAELVD